MTFIDTSQVARLAKDLVVAAPAGQAAAKAVTSRGALNVKRHAARLISGNSYAPYYPKSISYDTTVEDGVVTAEIGPDKSRQGRQGALGNILEYGTVNNAPIPHLGPALDSEEPKYVEYLGQAVEKAMGEVL